MKEVKEFVSVKSGYWFNFVRSRSRKPKRTCACETINMYGFDAYRNFNLQILFDFMYNDWNEHYN